ncbi:MAG: Glycosyltransferase, group 1 family protein, partial [Microgenomates group bacterium GW2011_GWC1_44_9]
LDFAKKTPKLGAVAPRLLNYDGSIQSSCSKFPTIWNAIKYNFFGCKNCFKKYIPGNEESLVEVAVMAAFLIPKSVYNYVGGLDERFFLYYEDVEYCRRLYRFGLPVFYFPQAKVQHVHGASGNFVSHLKSPLLKSAKIYYGPLYSATLNAVLWIGHKWQVILRRKKFRD